MNCRHGIEETQCYYCCLHNAALAKLKTEKEEHDEK
jgi:hypothetical protein